MRHSISFWLILWLCTALLVRGENFSLLFQDPDEVLTYGEARISNASTLLLAAVDSETSGVALFPSQVSAQFGFTTQFQWTTTGCNDMVSLAPSNHSDGVSFFMTPNPLKPAELESSQYFLGVGKFSSLFAVAYVAIYNEFYLCEWYNEAPVDYDVSLFRSKCQVFANPSERYTCGDFLFDIEYDYFRSLLTVRVDDVEKFVASTKVPAYNYYVGLSAGNDVYARQQEIAEWKWSSKIKVDSFTQREAAFPYSFGSTSVSSTVINVPASYANPMMDVHGAVFYENFVTPHNYFNVKFSYSVSLCAPSQTYSALSFAMVFMKQVQFTIPRQNVLLAAFIQPNTTVIGYHRAANAFYICNTAEYENGVCQAIPSPFPRPECKRAHQFEIMYEEGIAQIYLNGKFAAAGRLKFDVDAYVIGMTGSAVQQAIGLQSFGSWTYDATRSPIVTTDIDFASPNNSLSFYRSSTVIGNKVALTSKLEPNWQLGFMMFNEPFAAHLGFKARIQFTTDPNPYCETSPMYSDNIFTTMFITTDFPPAQQLQYASLDGLGLKQLNNTHLFTFDWGRREMRYCDWVTSACQSVPLLGEVLGGPLNYCTPVTKIFDIIFTGRQLVMTKVASMDSEIQIPSDQSSSILNIPLNIAQGTYYAGILGYNNRQASIISDWIFERHLPQRTTQFDLSFGAIQSHFSWIGNASLVNDELQIGEAGLVIHNTPFFAHKGFSTEFTWSPNCNSEQVSKPKGFSLFLSQSGPTLDMALKSNPLTGQFGSAVLPDVVSISYSRIEDKFYAYFGASSGVTFSAMNNAAPISCNDTHHIRIEFAVRNTIAIFIDDSLCAVLGDELGSIIERSYYYVGIAGEGLQQFGDWQYTAVIPQTLVIEYGFDNDTHLELFGTASVTDEGTLRLTTGGSESGAAMYPVPVFAHTGFNASITWTPTNCDAANNGADGFTLFLTKNLPLWEQVYNSAGGLLGIGNVPNTVIFAYSATFNEFYVCEWSTPLVERFGYGCDVVRAVMSPKYTCPDTHIFDFSYNHQVLEIRANGVLRVSAPLDLEPVQYYVGVSGATGGGYFQQDISRWYFESIVL